MSYVTPIKLLRRRWHKSPNNHQLSLYGPTKGHPVVSRDEHCRPMAAIICTSVTFFSASSRPRLVVRVVQLLVRTDILTAFESSNVERLSSEFPRGCFDGTHDGQSRGRCEGILWCFGDDTSVRLTN